MAGALLSSMVFLTSSSVALPARTLSRIVSNRFVWLFLIISSFLESIRFKTLLLNWPISTENKSPVIVSKTSASAQLDVTSTLESLLLKICARLQCQIGALLERKSATRRDIAPGCYQTLAFFKMALTCARKCVENRPLHFPTNSHVFSIERSARRSRSVARIQLHIRTASRRKVHHRKRHRSHQRRASIGRKSHRNKK